MSPSSSALPRVSYPNFLRSRSSATKSARSRQGLSNWLLSKRQPDHGTRLQRFPQIRLFRGSEEPVWVIALSSACERLGPDPRRALGPAATPAASTGRTRDRTPPCCRNVKKHLPGRRPH